MVGASAGLTPASAAEALDGRGDRAQAGRCGPLLGGLRGSLEPIALSRRPADLPSLREMPLGRRALVWCAAMMFLGGVFFPGTSMPAWLTPLADNLPLTFYSKALRAIMPFLLAVFFLASLALAGQSKFFALIAAGQILALLLTAFALMAPNLAQRVPGLPTLAFGIAGYAAYGLGGLSYLLGYCRAPWRRGGPKCAWRRAPACR